MGVVRIKKILIFVLLLGTIYYPTNVKASTETEINDYVEFDSFMKRYHEHTTTLAYYVSTSYGSNEHYFKENFNEFRNAINSVYDTNKSEFLSSYLDSAENLLSKPIALLGTADDLRRLLFGKIKDYFGGEEEYLDFSSGFPQGYYVEVEGLETQYFIDLQSVRYDSLSSSFVFTLVSANGTFTHYASYPYRSDATPEQLSYMTNVLYPMVQGSTLVGANLTHLFTINNMYPNKQKMRLKLLSDGSEIPYKTSGVSPEIENVFNNIINNFNNNNYPSHLEEYTPNVKPILLCPSGKIPLSFNDGVFSTSENVVITLQQDETAVLGDELCDLDFEFPVIEYDDEKKQIYIDEEELDIISQIGDYPDCDGVLCWFSNVFGIVKDLIKAVLGLPLSIMNGLTDLFKFLFIPSSDSFNGFINELNTTMSEKFNLTAFTNVFNEMTPNQNSRTMSTTSTNTFEGVMVEGLMGTGEVKIIDGDTINAMLPTLHSWIKGFFYVLLAFFNINHMYKLIRGTTIFESMRGKSE